MKKALIIIIIAAALLLLWGALNRRSNSTTDLNIPGDSTAAAGGAAINTMNSTAIIHTNRGAVTIELFDDATPVTTGNFSKLAREGYYDGIKFHRVISGFMVQSGDPISKDDTKKDSWGSGGPGYAITDEFGEGLSNVRGTLSMANAGPNTGGSQFFINLADNTFLDHDKEPLTSKHAVFGRVVSGMDVIEAIGASPTDDRDRPLEPIVIERIEIAAPAAGV